MPADPPTQLSTLRNALLKLHKTLLDSEQERYDHDVERITSRGQLLGLVLKDPFFAWLHELSELIVLIDETLASEEPPGDASRLLGQARTLLTPLEGGQGFRGQYFETLQRDPDVVIAHGEAMKVWNGLAG